MAFRQEIYQILQIVNLTRISLIYTDILTKTKKTPSNSISLNRLLH